MSTICIYCSAETTGVFRAAEHVVPRAFGTFDSREGNLTLHSVCEECNGYFGRHLEQFFARDSGDAFLRLLHGIKSPEEASEIGGRRVTFRFDCDGLYKGAWGELVRNAEHGFGIQLMPQAGFRRDGEHSTRWYASHELLPDRVSEFRRCHVTLIGSPDEVHEFQERLKELGVDIACAEWTAEDPDHPSDDKIWVQTRYAIDEVVRRTIAKIAFNYLAWTTKEFPDFVLRPQFDAIRRYIRYGIVPDWSPVQVQRRKLLVGDTDRYRQTDGHLLAVTWPAHLDEVRAHLSLFNQITYRITLARCSGYPIWFDVTAGHHFDWRNRVVEELSTATPLLITIPRT